MIIDDEADNASLNTRPDMEEESPTYKSIRKLRESLGSHTLLQYTATPQALLVIDRDKMKDYQRRHQIERVHGVLDFVLDLRREDLVYFLDKFP